MDIALILLLIAVVVFAVDAFIHRSLLAVGLAFFAASFLVKVL